MWQETLQNAEQNISMLRIIKGRNLMNKEKSCKEEQKDWIDYIVDNVYTYYDEREIVLWGKYDQSDNIKERLEKRYGLKVSFYVDSDAKRIDDVYIRPQQCLEGKAKRYYVVVPLGFYQSIKDELVSWGYRKDLDYFYFSDCIIQDTKDYYEDLHGNKLFGKHKNLKLCFRGFNTVIKLGQEVYLHDCAIYVHSNSRLEIGDRTEIERCSIFVGNNASLLVGSNGKFFGEGSLGATAESLLKIGNDFTVGTRYSLTAGKDTECIIGEDCMFSMDIILMTNDGSHSIFDVETRENINSTRKISQKRKVIIGNHVWVGIRSTILYNTSIGDGSIIGAESLVKNKIPNNCIAAGNPAKVIKKNVTWCRAEDSEDIAECGEAYTHFTDVNVQ